MGYRVWKNVTRVNVFRATHRHSGSLKTNYAKDARLHIMDILLVETQSLGLGVDQPTLADQLQNNPAVNILHRITCSDQAKAILGTNGGKNQGYDLALFDWHSVNLDPLALLSHLAAKDVATKVGFVADQFDLMELSQATKRGAAFFLHKNASQTELTQALKAFARTGQYLPASYRRELFGAERPDVELRLSSTQLAVLELMRQGESNPNIAELLRLPEQTVRGYVRTIFAALQVSAAPECVAGARDLGLTA